MTVKILLADDHDMFRESMSEMLADFNTDFQIVGAAANGLEAVELAARLSPDVILMDTDMPEMDGAEATRAIRQRCPGVHVLGLSLRADWQTVEDMLSAGANGFLIKTITLPQLSEAILRTAHGEGYLYLEAPV